jgi:hypothetical protein
MLAAMPGLRPIIRFTSTDIIPQTPPRPNTAKGRDAETHSRGIGIGSENRPQGVSIACDFTL